MADKEITSQIDKLRKTRPERAVDAELNAVADPMGNDADSLIAALSFLHTDLKEEARLIELAKIRGGTTLIKDRLMVASWLELFVIQLKRLAEEQSAGPVTPTKRLAGNPDLLRHRPSEIGTPAAVLPGPGGRCAVGNVHDEHTLKCPCGYDVTPEARAAVSLSRTEAFLSGASDELFASLPADVKLAGAMRYPPLPEAVADGKAIADYLSGASDQLDEAVFGPTSGIDLSAAMINDVGIDTPGAQALIDSLPNGSMTIVDAPKRFGDMTPDEQRSAVRRAGATLSAELNGSVALDAISSDAAVAIFGNDPADAEQDLHREIRNGEMTFPTGLDPADPFAPIPAARYSAGPVVPPGGMKWTAADLLAPVMAAAIPAHLSFSQVTTVTDCGAKYRMQRIARLPQVPQWANIGGKAFHAAVEVYESMNGRALIDDYGWDAAFHTEIARVESESDMGREQFRASNGGKENYDWWRVEGALMLKRYIAWRDGDGAGQALLNRPLLAGVGGPMLEWETTYQVDHVPFTTILDSVWLDETRNASIGERTAIIRDWKTGSLTPDDRQLCTQAWGLRKAGWQGQVLVQFFDARKGTFTEPFDPFERMSWDDVRYFVLSGDAERRLPILPARPSDFCGGCSVAYACPVMGQRKAPKK